MYKRIKFIRHLQFVRYRLLFGINCTTLSISFIVAERMCPNCHLAEVKLWCKKCETNYCSPCYELVHALPIFKSHVSVPIDSDLVMLIACSVHSDEKLKFWCDTCMILVCRDCIALRHQGHACTEIDNAATDKIKEVSIKFYLKEFHEKIFFVLI